MSCFLITYQDGHKVARPVTSREEYLALRDSKEQIQNLAKRAGATMPPSADSYR